MEPEVYCKKEKKKDCCCSWLIVAFVGIAVSFFTGVLVAALTTILTILGEGGIIAIIVALGVLLIVSLINAICCKKDNKHDHCC